MIRETNLRTPSGLRIPAYRLNTLIVGAGAAGMNCAVHLHGFLTRLGFENPEDMIAVVTSQAVGGASRLSGSDKQTYYKLGTSAVFSDSSRDLADTLTAHGCMHGDVALVEAHCSLQEFYHLVEIGVPFPHDPEGAYVGYKTDHDPKERATSAGPKTSRYMCECLDRQAELLGIKVFAGHEAAHLLVRGEGESREIVGLVTLDKQRLAEPCFGITVFLSENMVLAAGGPGDLYRVSVYPEGQCGIHGLALAAGLKAQNLTESQFGLASTKFRWNVSGTYMQAVPRIFSSDADGGGERDFLASYFDSTAQMATNIFLKGYQWPFDPHRVLDKQSSLIDVLVYQETEVLKRRVYLDFRSNPVPGAGLEPFDILNMCDEATGYLKHNNALLPTPIQRLEHMNPMAIDVYAEHGIDIRSEPLEINVCAQHHNGGFAVDKWWQSNVPRVFVIGEMAGTHGVKRPGGSALNSGQVGGLRAAEYIAHNYTCSDPVPTPDDGLLTQIDAVHSSLSDSLLRRDGLAWKELLETVQGCMSGAAALFRSREQCISAKETIPNLYKDVRARGIAVTHALELTEAVRASHLIITALAFLEAIDEYLRSGGGSRGSYVVVDPSGTPIHEDITDLSTGMPVAALSERMDLRETIAEVSLESMDPLVFRVSRASLRPAPSRDEPFEASWRSFRNGEVYRL